MSKSGNEAIPASASDADALDLAKAMTAVQLEAAKEIIANSTVKPGETPDPALVGQVAQTIAINQATVVERLTK